MNKVAILFVTTLSAQLAFGQRACNGRFNGRVLDEQGEALIGAALLLDPSGNGTVTDVEGKFEFTQICPGLYHVTVQYLGYQEQVFEITLNGRVEKEITLQPNVETLREVVVKEELAHLENAQNYTVLSGEKLAETAGKSLGESLREVSGVNTIQAGPGIFKPVIHGVHSQRVLILNHGIRQEGQQWGAEHAPEIDPFIASNIVVVKDASSIKYGTDALGGVVIVNPADLPEQPGLGGSVSMIGQSNGRSGTVSAMLEGGLNGHEGWGWRAQGTGKRSGDFHAPDYSLTNTGIKELNFSGAAGYHKGPKGFEVFFSHFRTELGILAGTAISNIDDLIVAMESEPPQRTTDFGYEIDEPRQKVSHNLLKLNGHIEREKGEWRLQYGFQNNNRKEFDIRKGDLSGKPSIDLQLNTHTIEAEWESTPDQANSFCIGINGMYQDNNNIFGTQRIPFIPNYNNFSGGLFGVTKLVRAHWVYDFGARYDYRYYSVVGYDYKNALYRETLNFQNVSFTAGATTQLNNTQSLAINVSSSWRPPHVAELYSVGTHQSAAAIEYGLLLNDSTNEVLDINDVSFKIERALKGVSTYRYQKNNLTIELSGYANYIFNYIYLKPTGITRGVRGAYPYFRYTQTDALFLGVDVTADWNLSRQWKLSPKASLIRASDQRNKDLLVFIPSNKYELAWRFEEPNQFPVKRFFAELK
ncbi:MAG: TonB-dependent receptor, partial [Cyclobacteriaceae bacterium]|nr:TonB-dependent receptor [Cyclobacteriaceae bacterium]